MNPNTGLGFSNIQNAPTVQQPPAQSASSSQRIMFNPKYLFSITGILRIALIISQFACWISAAAVVKPGYDGKGEIPGYMIATRGAVLFFSIVGFFIAIMFFVINIFNFVNLRGINKLPWNLIFLGTNLLWLIPTFICAIVSAVRENNVRDLIVPNSEAVNKGAFASAAFFGFLNTIIYAVDSAYHLVTIVRSGVNAPPAYIP